MRPVLHVAPRIRSRGGIESLIALWRRMPGPQEHVALFDPGGPAPPGQASLAATWRTPLAVMRRRFRAAVAPSAGALVVYHNGWGLPLFHDLDGAARRVAVLHADPAFHAPDLEGWRGLLDGVLGCCPGLEDLPARVWPEIAGGRSAVFRMPAALAAPATPRPSPRPGELVLGYAGRLERAQKGLHWLPALVAALDARGVCFRFEVIGEGTLRRWLMARCDARVRFLGWVDPVEAFHRRLGTWDAAVYFSENEGGPIALLEAMAAGAVPFYPRRHGSWADRLVPLVDPRCHYPPGDMPALAGAIAELFATPEPALAGMREHARQLVAGHTAAQFLETTRDFLERIDSLPRVSATRARAPRASDWLPLGLVTRVYRAALRRS